MYVPPAFREQDLPTLHAFMHEHSFATFLTAGDPPFITHLPLLIDPSRGANGTLLGHVAKANPHAALLNGTRATAIFHGPHAYVSPSWYDPSKPSVPTWNYAVVHATGIPVIHNDPAWMKDLLSRMVAKYESPRATPWTYNLPPEFLTAMLTQIVAFEMPIDTLEGKFKLNQNRSKGDQERVMAGLANEGEEGTAGLMRRRKGD